MTGFTDYYHVHRLKQIVFRLSNTITTDWVFRFQTNSHTSISMFQSQAHFNNLHTELIIEVTHAEHL